MNYTKPFPDYFNAKDSLNDLIISENAIANGCDAAFGDIYTKFVNVQPKCLVEPLNSIATVQKKEHQAIKAYIERLAAFDKDLGELNVINTEINNKLATIKNAENAASKTQAAALRSPNEANNQKAKAAGDSAAVLKESSQGEINDLKKQFMTVLADSLKSLADARIQMNNQFADIAKELNEITENINGTYNDPMISRLSQRADKLQYELVE